MMLPWEWCEAFGLRQPSAALASNCLGATESSYRPDTPRLLKAAEGCRSPKASPNLGAGFPLKFLALTKDCPEARKAAMKEKTQGAAQKPAFTIRVHLVDGTVEY